MKDGLDLQVSLLDPPTRPASSSPTPSDSQSLNTASVVGLRRQVDRLQRELTALKQREAEARAAVERFDDEMRLFGRVQRDWLPSTLPDVAGLDIQTLYHPVDRVGGDYFDIFRLDDARIGIILLDATGHGPTAALIASRAGHTMRHAMEGQGGQRVADPKGILARVNRSLLAKPMADCHFVSGLCAVYDEGTGVIRWARGGAPYPILISKDDHPVPIKSGGPLVGVDERARFESVELEMRPGDRLLFHTDGVHVPPVGPAAGHADRDLEETDWYRRLANHSNEQALSQLRSRMTAVPTGANQTDDVTVVALEAVAVPEHRHNARRPSKQRSRPQSPVQIRARGASDGLGG